MTDDLRQRYAEAIGTSMILRMSPAEIADAVLAVRDEEMERLRADLAKAEKLISDVANMDTDSVEIAFDDLHVEAIEQRHRADQAEAEVARLHALTATCTCPDSYETYAGPEAECPVHGSVRALNEATAAIDRHRDRAATLTAWAHAELGQETRVLHYVLSVIVNLSDTLVLPDAPGRAGGSQ